MIDVSRARSRPTREETHERLLLAAATTFAAKGITGASIEDICDEAGFSRGAFYSNFENKNDLVLQLLDVHLTENQNEIERLYQASESPEEFLLVMESDQRERTAPLGNYGVLHMELVLYALRDPANRPRLIERQRRLRELNRDVVQRIGERMGKTHPMSVDDIVTLILAFDDGLALHNLIDPDSVRPTQFSDTMVVLQRMWQEMPEEAD